MQLNPKAQLLQINCPWIRIILEVFYFLILVHAEVELYFTTKPLQHMTRTSETGKLTDGTVAKVEKRTVLLLRSCVD